MAEPKEQIISIVGAAYFQPIADLWSRLVGSPFPARSDVQAPPRENGYSAALCILAVACVESYLMRARFKNRSHPASEKRRPLDFIEALFPDFRNLEAITEAFVLRDAVIHNHLWTVDYTWDDESPIKLLEASLDSISGDSKYRNCVDLLTRQTQALQLNVIPNRIDRLDVARVVAVVWDTLAFLESKGRDFCYVSNQFVKRDDQLVPFAQIVTEMRSLLQTHNQRSAAGRSQGVTDDD